MDLYKKLDEFIISKDHCFLLQGLWGVGKTYSLNQWVKNGGNKDYAVVNISLFGVSNVNELNSLVLNSEGFINKVSTVNPNGTSRYAYDGSGEVKRDNDNYSICKFVSGKIYNCDLSASYNIAARYYIRETLKPLDVNSRSELETKASLALSGTKLTYNTFKVLLSVI